MRCYLKKFQTFELVASHYVIDYAVKEGDTGSITLLEPNAVQLMTDYIGCWCLFDNDVYYVTAASPNESKLVLNIASPVQAFSRPQLFDNQSTFGELMQDAISDGYINGGGDDAYKMPYLSVSSNSALTFTPDVDDYNYYVPSEAMLEAIKDGVKITFEVSGTHSQYLTINITDDSVDEIPIVFGDGHHILTGESYDASSTAKATVVQQLEDESGAQYFETTDYYLSADHHISTTPPANRAVGGWNVYECTKDQSPLAVATGAFSGNSASHKIEFSSDRKYKLYQPLRLRLRDEVFTTEITQRTKSSNSNLYSYACGDLNNTITQKVQKIADAQKVVTVNGRSGNVLLDAYDLGAVPTSRTINGHALDEDITLTGDDISITPDSIGAVPKTRKVNGKALSSDISLIASDVGARASSWSPTFNDIGNYSPQSGTTIKPVGLIAVGLVNSSTQKVLSHSGPCRYLLIVNGNATARTAMYSVVATTSNVYVNPIITGSNISITEDDTNGKITIKGTASSNSYAFIIGLDAVNRVIVS